MSRIATKLILTQEVTGLGAPGDVVEVAAGYGRNYLIPRGFAIRWTRGGEKQVEQIKRARSVREIRTLEEAQAAAGQLERLTVRLKRKSGSNGRLFGSVGPSDIATAVKDAGGPDVDKRKIVVTDPIKTAGAHRVQVRLHPEVSAAVKIDVQAV
jgi:large subunit ribosomal protein L9